MNKTVKILGASMLLVSSVILGGCGSNTSEKSKDEANEQVKDGNSEVEVNIKYIKMSPEETKSLVEGQSIRMEEDKVIKQPDRETLEEMGLDYEIIVRTKVWDKDGTTHLNEDIGYLNAEQDYEFEHIKFEDDEYEFILYCINIVPIIEVYQDGNNLFKVIRYSNGAESMPLKLLNEKNFELLQSLLNEKTE